MTSNQERKLSMYQVVYALLTSTLASIIAQMPLINQMIITLGTNINAILDYESSQILDRTGIRQTKKSLAEQLIIKAIDIANRISAYAANTGNLVLLKEVNYSLSYLEKQADNVLLSEVNTIHQKANDNITNLEDYGLLPNDLVEFKQSIDQFEVYIPKPRASILEKKDATVSLKQLFVNTDALLKNNLDPLIKVVQFSQPHFYKTYKESRNIIQAGTRALALRCTVKDTNGIAIQGVKAVTSNMKPLITKSKGVFYAKNFPQGTHTFIFSKEGYTDQTVTITIVNNERTDIIVTLLPNS